MAIYVYILYSPEKAYANGKSVIIIDVHNFQLKTTPESPLFIDEKLL